MNSLENIIKNLVSEIKKLQGVNNNDVIYKYDPVEKEYNIIHNFQHLIDEDDDFTYAFGTLLSIHLFEKDFFNVNIFEDEEIIEQYTTSMTIGVQPKQEWDKFFKQTHQSDKRITEKLLSIAA